MDRIRWDPNYSTRYDLDPDMPCEMCGGDFVTCPCPFCGVCGEKSNPECYDVEGHGLEEPPGYCERLERERAARAVELESEDAAWRQIDREYRQSLEELGPTFLQWLP